MNNYKYAHIIKKLLLSVPEITIISCVSLKLYALDGECILEFDDEFSETPKIRKNYKGDFVSAVKHFDKLRKSNGHGDEIPHKDDLSIYGDELKVVILLDAGIEVRFKGIYIRTLCGRMVVAGELDDKGYIRNEKEFNEDADGAIAYFRSLINGQTL